MSAEVGATHSLDDFVETSRGNLPGNHAPKETHTNTYQTRSANIARKFAHNLADNLVNTSLAMTRRGI
jgi:hypothetical protein